MMAQLSQNVDRVVSTEFEHFTGICKDKAKKNSHVEKQEKSPCFADRQI